MRGAFHLFVSLYTDNDWYYRCCYTSILGITMRSKHQSGGNIYHHSVALLLMMVSMYKQLRHAALFLFLFLSLYSVSLLAGGHLIIRSCSTRRSRIYCVASYLGADKRQMNCKARTRQKVRVRSSSLVPESSARARNIALAVIPGTELRLFIQSPMYTHL